MNNFINHPIKFMVGGLIAPFIVLIAIFFIAQTASSAEAPRMQMQTYEPSLKDIPSLQRGAKLFVNYCLSCHSAKYMRYNRMADDLKIPPKLVVRDMMFAADKIGEPMTTTMTPQQAEKWFGVAPPDLSLIARLRGAQWLYNYFLAFYLDENSPSGWNNLVFENVAMPHAMYELQGRQRAVFKTVQDADGNSREVLDYFEKVSDGIMSAAEYEQAARDLTNFLIYVGEPAKLVRVKYGLWVMLFFGIFIALAYYLKKEFWRDVKGGN